MSVSTGRGYEAYEYEEPYGDWWKRASSGAKKKGVELSSNVENYGGERFRTYRILDNKRLMLKTRSRKQIDEFLDIDASKSPGEKNHQENEDIREMFQKEADEARKKIFDGTIVFKRKAGYFMPHTLADRNAIQLLINDKLMKRSTPEQRESEDEYRKILPKTVTDGDGKEHDVVYEFIDTMEEAKSDAEAASEFYQYKEPYEEWAKRVEEAAKGHDVIFHVKSFKYKGGTWKMFELYQGRKFKMSKDRLAISSTSRSDVDEHLGIKISSIEGVNVPMADPKNVSSEDINSTLGESNLPIIDDEGEALGWIVKEFESNKSGKQTWPLIDASELKKAFSDDNLDNVIKKIIGIAYIIYVNTILVGHTSEDPKDYLRTELYGKEWDEATWKKFVDHVGKRYGDRGGTKLMNLVQDLEVSDSFDDQRMIVGDILSMPEFTDLFVSGDIDSILGEVATPDQSSALQTQIKSYVDDNFPEMTKYLQYETHDESGDVRMLITLKHGTDKVRTALENLLEDIANNNGFKILLEGNDTLLFTTAGVKATKGSNDIKEESIIMSKKIEINEHNKPDIDKIVSTALIESVALNNDGQIEQTNPVFFLTIEGESIDELMARLPKHVDVPVYVNESDVVVSMPVVYEAAGSVIEMYTEKMAVAQTKTQISQTDDVQQRRLRQSAGSAGSSKINRKLEDMSSIAINTTKDGRIILSGSSEDDKSYVARIAEKISNNKMVPSNAPVIVVSPDKVDEFSKQVNRIHRVLLNYIDGKQNPNWRIARVKIDNILSGNDEQLPFEEVAVIDELFEAVLDERDISTRLKKAQEDLNESGSKLSSLASRYGGTIAIGSYIAEIVDGSTRVAKRADDDKRKLPYVEDTDVVDSYLDATNRCLIIKEYTEANARIKHLSNMAESILADRCFVRTDNFIAFVRESRDGDNEIWPSVGEGLCAVMAPRLSTEGSLRRTLCSLPVVERTVASSKTMTDHMVDTYKNVQSEVSSTESGILVEGDGWSIAVGKDGSIEHDDVDIDEAMIEAVCDGGDDLPTRWCEAALLARSWQKVSESMLEEKHGKIADSMEDAENILIVREGGDVTISIEEFKEEYVTAGSRTYKIPGKGKGIRYVSSGPSANGSYTAVSSAKSTDDDGWESADDVWDHATSKPKNGAKVMSTMQMVGDKGTKKAYMLKASDGKTWIIDGDKKKSGSASSLKIVQRGANKVDLTEDTEDPLAFEQVVKRVADVIAMKTETASERKAAAIAWTECIVELLNVTDLDDCKNAAEEITSWRESISNTLGEDDECVSYASTLMRALSHCVEAVAEHLGDAGTTMISKISEACDSFTAADMTKTPSSYLTEGGYVRDIASVIIDQDITEATEVINPDNILMQANRYRKNLSSTFKKLSTTSIPDNVKAYTLSAIHGIVSLVRNFLNYHKEDMKESYEKMNSTPAFKAWIDLMDSKITGQGAMTKGSTPKNINLGRELNIARNALSVLKSILLKSQSDDENIMKNIDDLIKTVDTAMTVAMQLTPGGKDDPKKGRDVDTSDTATLWEDSINRFIEKRDAIKDLTSAFADQANEAVELIDTSIGDVSDSIISIEKMGLMDSLNPSVLNRLTSEISTLVMTITHGTDDQTKIREIEEHAGAIRECSSSIVAEALRIKASR